MFQFELKHPFVPEQYNQTHGANRGYRLRFYNLHGINSIVIERFDEDPYRPPGNPCQKD